MVMNLGHIPRVIHQPFNVEKAGFIQNKTFEIDRIYIAPSVIMVFSGSGILEQNGKTTVLESPFMMWNFTGEKKRFYPTPSWEELYIGFPHGSEKQLRQTLKQEFFRLQIRKLQNPIQCRKIAEDIRLLLELPPLPGMADRLDQFAMQLLTEAVFPRHHDLLNHHEKILNNITEYINRHFKENLNLGHVAEKFGWSYSTFQRQWRLRNSCTPLQYMNRLRDMAAKQLLLESDWSIAEISEHLGFCNQFYFSRFFQQINGITPARFRNKALSGTNGKTSEDISQRVFFPD